MSASSDAKAYNSEGLTAEYQVETALDHPTLPPRQLFRDRDRIGWGGHDVDDPAAASIKRPE